AKRGGAWGIASETQGLPRCQRRAWMSGVASPSSLPCAEAL
ncbi:MAG: hypothetical protein AVDCRST_MAG15-2558, partial [uncultured Rubellimicrobium sp.]